MSTKSSLIFADLERSVDFLTEISLKPKDDYMRAAAIQGFEICFELAWKYLQSRLLESGLQANSPRAAFRESGKAGLLDNIDLWIRFTEQRNLTVHTYHRQLADEIYDSIRESFLPAIQDLLKAVPASTDI